MNSREDVLPGPFPKVPSSVTILWYSSVYDLEQLLADISNAPSQPYLLFNLSMSPSLKSLKVYNTVKESIRVMDRGPHRNKAILGRSTG